MKFKKPKRAPHPHGSGRNATAAAGDVLRSPALVDPGKPAVRMRLAPGIHAVSGDEIEIRAASDGARIAGGNGVTEFNLWVETWVDIVTLR